MTIAMLTRSGSTRVIQCPGGDVLVERLRPGERWVLRRYRKDHAGFVNEVRPDGSCLPVGLGLTASLSPLHITGDLLDAIDTELRRG